MRWVRGLFTLILLMLLGGLVTARYIQLEEQAPQAIAPPASISPNLVGIGVLAVLVLLVLRALQVVVMRAMDRAAHPPDKAR